MSEILIVAGEASGDLHASAVVRELRLIRPDLALTGLGGARMQAEGVELLERTDSGVMGFVEVLKHIPAHLRALRAIGQRLASGRVKLALLLDYPGFNMRVAAAAKKAGVPVLYYITPQVWAWGAGRLPKLARLVTRAAVILPFEEQLLKGYGIDARFVGHPLLDRLDELPSREDARRSLGVPADVQLLALFPGSRAQEIDRHLAEFVEAARRLAARRPRLRVVIAGAPALRTLFDEAPFPVVEGESFSVLRAADAAIVKSGTTTLEAAIAGCPIVVAYRADPISYLIARNVVRIPHIALVNVVAGRAVARELIQDEVTGEALADAVEPLLDAGPDRDRLVAGLGEVRAKLGRPGASRAVAEMAVEMIG